MYLTGESDNEVRGLFVAPNTEKQILYDLLFGSQYDNYNYF